MTHLHAYEQDVRDGRPSFVVCSVCGFSAPKADVLRCSMVLDRQLSVALLAERRAGAVLIVATDPAGNPKKILREIVGHDVIGGAR